MPKVKDFDDVGLFVGLVVNENWAVQEFAHTRPFSRDATHPGEASEQVNVVQQRTAKARGCLSVVPGNMTDDFSEIV